MKTEEIKQLLSDTLIEIPLARKQSEEVLLGALFRGCMVFPVFPSQQSVVPSWLEEALPLAQQQEPETFYFLRVRKAEVSMRTLDLDAARAQLDAVLTETDDERVVHYAHLTMARVLIRQHEFKAADQHLQKALTLHVDKDDWLAGRVHVARAELFLEKDESKPAREAFEKALEWLPGWAVEEKVQSFQSLAFLATVKQDAKRSLKYFRNAAELLEAASVWPELVQMQLATASLLLTSGRGNEAISLFQQAREICLAHEITQWQTPIEVGLARAARSTQSADEARNQTLELARQCARRGDTTGFISMVLLLVGIDTDQKDFESAYRILALGQSISKYLKLPMAVNIFRAQIDQLRDDIMGSEKFEKMAAKMLADAQGKTH